MDNPPYVALQRRATDWLERLYTRFRERHQNDATYIDDLLVSLGKNTKCDP